MKSLSLIFIWGIRNKLRAEGDKLRAEGDELWAEGNKLRAEGDELRAEGNKLWAEAIIEVHGNIRLEWKYIDDMDDYACKLETGEIFEPVTKEAA